MSRFERPFRRYVAIGDSSTEGWIDPDGSGGLRGWANRLAERIASVQREQGGLLYANLGVRGKRTREILDEQLAPALAMRPDLVTLFSGTNDVIARRFDPVAVAADIERLQRALVGSGATVLTFTLPDLAPVMPVARLIAPRLAALNDAVRRISAATGVRLVDFAAHPVASDPRLWHDDRLHANSAGHARIAAALAEALGVAGSDGSWADPLPGPAAGGRLARLRAEVAWTRRHLLPWLAGRVTGGRPERAHVAKRPRLLAVGPAPEAEDDSVPSSPRPAVYVDPLLRYAWNPRHPWRATCHLFADSTEDLHRFAARLGMRRDWIQVGNSGLPHYDLNDERRALAIELGAIALTRRASVVKWREIRAGLKAVRRRSGERRRSGMVQPEGVEPPTLSSEG